ncbi:MAG: hypothetical protein M0R77_02535 [Gammaproteobacteria bacterium]|nr:hypothetical protein [Gammaproteobacteria bacterium]
MSRGKELRLRSWRQFRDSIADLDTDQKLDSINKFWMLYPFSKRTVDPDNPENWMNPWDMVYHDEICEYSRGIMMHQTALMMIDGIDDSYLVYAIDSEKQRDVMIAVINGKALNYGMDIVDFDEVLPSLNIQNKFKSNKKGSYTIL